MSTTARSLWTAAYRAARASVKNRAALAFDPLQADQMTSPRAAAESAVYEAVRASVPADVGAAMDHNPFAYLWLSSGVTTALRPPAPVREPLQVAVLNGWGALFRYPPMGEGMGERRRHWHALDQRRRAMVRRLYERGALLEDSGHHPRRVNLPLAA